MAASTPRKPYPSDLSDEHWLILQPLLPADPGGGRKRTTDFREVVNAILYVDVNGCVWKGLPHDFPPEGTVRYYFHQWRRRGLWQRLMDTLRERLRQQEGRQPQPTAAIIDSQSVKGTRTSGTRGYDGGKKIKGTKRHFLVDTLGLLLLVVVHSAGIQDRDGAKLVFAQAKERFPSLRLVWADGGYAGKLIGWLAALCGWVLEIVKRSDTAKGFVLLPRRWVVERTISWVNNYRRLSKDYEYHTQTSEAFIQIAMIHVMLRRLTAAKQVKCAAA
jgi:putative transposase